MPFDPTSLLLSTLAISRGRVRAKLEEWQRLGGGKPARRTFRGTLKALPRFMAMRRLIYLSLAVTNLSEDQVAAIVSTSSLRNNEAGITGMLWFNGIHFAQVLEGEREAVASTMRRIVQDERHTSIELVSDGDDDRRLYGNWGMTRANDDPERLTMSMIMLGRARAMEASVGGRLGEIVSSSLD